MIRKCSVTGFFPRMRNLHDPPQIQCGIYLAPPQIQYGICMAPPRFPPPPQHFSNEHSLRTPVVLGMLRTTLTELSSSYIYICTQWQSKPNCCQGRHDIRKTTETILPSHCVILNTFYGHINADVIW